jgi:hypothetical protein
MTTSKMNLISKLVLGIFCFFSSWGWAQAAVPSGKTTVIYFGSQGQEYFDKTVKPTFENNFGSCKNCEIVNNTPYTKEGAVDYTALKERIENLPTNASLVFFDFNFKVNDQNKDLVDALNKKSSSGILIVASAGTPKAAESSSPLSRTVLGQVHGAVIIGELTERDALMPLGFYGPEMLTALRPPKDMIGKGLTPLIFVSHLAYKWPKRSSQEWSDYFKTKKMKSRKIWLDLDDLF